MTKYDSMFDAIQNNSYQTTKKKRKNYDEQFSDIQNNSYELIAPVNKKKKKKDGILDNWVQAPQVFDDGYQFGDVSKTILGTASDIGLGIVQGIVAGGEGIGDLLSYGAAGISNLVGNEELANQLKENAKINATEEIFGVVKNRTGLEKASVVGSKGDQVSNAIGTILTLTSTAGLGGAAGLGKTGQTLVSMGSMGASSVGSGMSEAYQSGATDEEAVKYGLISGAAEVGSEMLFGGLGRGAKAVGISKGLTGADDMLAKTISDKFKSQLAKNLAEYTVKAGAEGVEEVISGLAQAWGKKMTYMSDEDLAKLIQDEKLLDQFIVGFVSSGVSQAPGLVKTTSKGQDYLTGYTQNEQKVYDALLQERINEAQSESKKPLTKKQINAIEEEFRQDFENGNISTKKIEEVLGYEDIYNNLKDTTENALAKTLTAQDEAGIREEAKQEYAKRIKDDEFIKKNYYEDTQRTKAYNVDVNQYDKKYRGTIQKAIDSGILNNSTKTHQFVDFISKLAADKGVTFDFTNNEALKNSSLGIDGATVNGYVNANGDITLNINSAKSLNSVVGHEITHVLEGSELYQALSDSLKEYADTIGEYDKRIKDIQELPYYNELSKEQQIKELNADLVGDYLFTNQEFINHLTQNRNLFQRIYDEIKYLVKQATAGSKEQRQLLKAQKMFEQAYRDNKVKMAGQENSTQPRYSISKSGEMVDENNKKVELDLSNTGNTGTLMAIHNLSEDKLNGVLDLGGFPVPSIAITSADKTGQLRYGNITVLFDKNTINPQVKENEVYSSDIYSSRFPVLENKINDNVINDLVKKSNYELSYQELKMLAEENRFNADRVPEDLMKVFFNDKGIEWNEQNRDYYENNDDGYNEYSKWVNDLSKQIIGEKRVVKPDVDYYTPSGNIRSIEQRTLPYTLENVVKIMTKKSTKGSEGNGWTGTGEIRGNLSPALKSIEEIKQNENKLITTEEMEQYKNKIEDDFSKITDKLGQYYKYKDTNSYYVLDTVADSINETAKAKKVNTETLKSKLADNFIEGVPDEVLNETIDFLNSLKNAPTEYFEAKPQRAVGLDEIQQVVIPSNASQELRDRLQEMGIPFTEYNPEVEGDRQRVINQFDDLKFSMSKQNEDIAPIGDYNIYGEDIELQQTAPIRQDLVDLQNDIAAIREDYRQQSEDIKKELQALREEREELDRGVNEVVPMEEYTPVESDIAPYESETAYHNTNVVPLDDNELKKYKKYFKDEFKFKGKQLDAAMDGIKELSAKPDLTQNDVYKYFKDNFGKEETKIINDAINEAKSELKYMEIGVSDEIKKDVAYRYEKYGDFRKKNFGKLKLVDYDGTNGVDTRFQELSNMFPDLFNAEKTINPADQLMRISEVANDKGYDTYFEELPDELVRAYSDELYSMINDYRNETTQSLAEEQIPIDYLENIAPVGEEDTIDTYYEDLNNRISSLENQLNGLPNREQLDIYNRRLDTELSERIEPEKRDILDLINQENSRKAGKNVELTKPVIAKEKGTIRSGIDTLKTMFVNANAEIDNLARESGNKMIKIAGDMLNNYSAEAQNDITTAQTDNYGNAIGKSVQQLFEPVKEKGLEAPFNDYLINYSNIDRWARGKGSKTPLNVSKRLVADYETKYPQFERWAKDIWKYAENIRNNWLESGMISQNMYKVLSEAYPHYVPYISDTNSFDATMDKMDELKARPIKRAVGGATELFPVEEALTRYTFAQKRAYRTNELYKQIYNSLQTNPGQRGAEVGEGYFTGEEPNLYRDDSGNYITAVIDGEERTIQISDDLFKALRNDMQTQVKDLENRLSLITKPLQTVSNIRRKLLTTWNPIFLVKNVVKDIQDGLFNSKHTGGLVLNYLPSIKELITKSTPEVKQYLALSGNEALRGDYETDLYQPKKGLKNNKFLKALSNANEIMEQAPRYAEFKASLQAGDSVEEAMYNSREVTTNFARGGVITKALNRNGFTFLNASVQGFDKFIRNFSGENGARGIANSLLKAVMLGVAPAVFNELAFGGGDDKDEEYDVLPDYIKDNYYLIKTGDGNFVRIPKGRMLSVFGSAARRTIELAEGEEDAFEGYLSNVNNQIGVSNPEENNIFAPFIQAYGSENGTAWYGGDIVPSRLQDKPKNEQYDASTDKFSIWLSNTALGKKMGLSPYKVNYVLDQYSGAIGDIALPMITDEATSDGGVFAPISDQFVVDSITDNKYVSEFYSKNDELKVKANSSEATDKDYLRNQYMYGISKEMGKLYAERREIQSNNSLTKEEKYRKSQAIKEQINKLAKNGLEGYDDISITGNYAHVGYDMGYYKNAKGNWTPIDQKDIIATESIGLTDREMSAYYGVKNDMYNIDQKYEPKLKTASDEEKTQLNAQKKVEIINSIKKANLPDEGKAALYDKKYADTDTLNAVLDCNIDFDSYLNLQAQNFTADKNIYGKTINGSKKNKVYGYINSMDMPYEQKIMLAKLEYKSDNTYNNEIINYLNNDPTISYQDMTSILKAMGFKVDEYGNITW